MKNTLLEIIDYEYYINSNEEMNFITDINSKISKYVKNSSIVPDIIYLCSSSELLAWVVISEQTRLIDEILYNNSGIEIKFIAQGCLGLYATINEFEVSSFKHALIVLLEAPGKYQQFCLDAIGMGVYNGNDGFVAQEGYAFVRLEKIERKAKDNTSYYINSSSIFLQEQKLSGIKNLIIELKSYLLNSVTDLTEIISFAVQHKYSEIIIRGLDVILPKELSSENWLQSIEQNSKKHFMTLKPLIEFDIHRKDNMDLLIMTVGAGGRFGVMSIRKGILYERNKTFFNCCAPIEFDYKKDVSINENIFSCKSNDEVYTLIRDNNKSLVYSNASYYMWSYS